MDTQNENKYHWKRILIVMTIMTLLSITMGRIGNQTGENKDPKIINHSNTLKHALLIDTTNLAGAFPSSHEGWTPFGFTEELAQIPEVHKNRIMFLDQASTNLAHEAAGHYDILCGDDGFGNKPFSGGCYQSVIEYRIQDYKDLKSWLRNLGIPLENKVFILPAFGAKDDPAYYATWEMIIEYADAIFSRDNLVVVSADRNWCLHYHHDDVIKFAKNPG